MARPLNSSVKQTVRNTRRTSAFNQSEQSYGVNSLHSTGNNNQSSGCSTPNGAQKTSLVPKFKNTSNGIPRMVNSPLSIRLALKSNPQSHLSNHSSSHALNNNQPSSSTSSSTSQDNDQILNSHNNQRHYQRHQDFNNVSSGGSVGYKQTLTPTKIRYTKRQMKRINIQGNSENGVGRREVTINNSDSVGGAENRANPNDSAISPDKQRANVRPTSLKLSKIPILQNEISSKVISSVLSVNVPNRKGSLQKSNSTPTCNLLVPREINRKYEIGPVIGDGNFAVVHECVHKLYRKRYAMKIINKRRCKGKETSKTEVAILRKINHPFIIKLLEDYDYAHEMYLVMELVTGGDLYYAITNKSRYSEIEAKGMITNLLQALAYLHSNYICHRDIKPENLLVSAKRNGKRFLKLADFGLAVEILPAQRLYEVCGSPIYVAPEIISETGYNFKVDIWATGVIAYILLCGFPPFYTDEGENDDELFVLILQGNYEFSEEIWDTVSTEAKDFISRLLVVEQETRLTALEALRHPWIAEDAAFGRTNDSLS